MISLDDKAVDQYLARHAEPEAQLAAGLVSAPTMPYRNCVVIPAYREDWQDIRRACERLPGPFLLILIVNAPEPEPRTTRLLDTVLCEGQMLASGGNVTLLSLAATYDVLLVDRCSGDRTIPRRCGVGLARKIGADIALALMAARIVTTGLIYTTDADAELPRSYFAHGLEDNAPAALVFPFRHKASSDLQTAILLYEISMLYYVAGLIAARSAYAHLTIGSTIAVNPLHYARVRGFPKRNAAEDFYLLNKLAKTGSIHQLAGPVIELDARLSDRTPFGTGPSLQAITALRDPTEEYLFYHPDIFAMLGKLNAWLHDEPQGTQPLPAPLVTWLEQSGLPAHLDHWRQSLSPDVARRRIDDWMDGFRTLKFVHYMRDKHLPSRPLMQIVGSELFQGIDASDPGSLARIRAHLARVCFGQERTRTGT